MRYDMVSGILLILSIIEIVALAAPVLVQEKRQTSIDEVHMSRDVTVITVLGSGWTMNLRSFPAGRWVFLGHGKDRLRRRAHCGQRPGARRGSMNTVQAPVPVPAPLDIYAPSSSAPPGPSHESMNTVQAPVPDTAPSDTYAPSSSAPPGLDHGLTDAVQAPTPNPVPSTANLIPFDRIVELRVVTDSILGSVGLRGLWVVV